MIGNSIHKDKHSKFSSNSCSFRLRILSLNLSARLIALVLDHRIVLCFRHNVLDRGIYSAVIDIRL